MVVSRWVWVAGWRRCARGKCMQRIANRIVMVLSRWLWVVGLRRCARGKCVQRVANRIVLYGGVNVGLGGRLAALCQGEVHAKSCKSHCAGGWVAGWRRCARGKRMQRIANRIVMVLSRRLWVVGLRRCARGKCIQRVANRIVMVVSRWLWVVGWRRCARGKELQVAFGGVKVDLGGRWRKSRDFNRQVLRK